MMEFDDNKPIYIQIADNICERILEGQYKAGDRISSVREWGATIGVNPNTVARSYELLAERGVIENSRGIGFFITRTATERIKEFERKVFLENELPSLIRKAELLEINLKEHIK